MTDRIDNIKLKIGENESKLVQIARKKLGMEPKFFKILKKSLDARDKGNIVWIYSIAFSDECGQPEHPLEKLKTSPSDIAYPENQKNSLLNPASSAII